MIFVSYYSGNSYKICSNRLIPSLKKFNLPYDIKEINDTGNYKHNISFKPEFVRDNLLKHKQPVCWLDVDCEVIQYPKLLMEKNSENINLQIYNWYGDSDNHITRKNKNILSKIGDLLTGNNNTISNNKLLSSSGVFCFNYSKESLSLVEEWSKEMKKNPNKIDDQTLDQVFNNGGYVNKLKCRWLPKSYNRMVWYPDWLNVKPVINHTKSDVCSINN